MINIGIAGGTGFTAGELLRILAGHPEANVKWVYSRTNNGKPLHSAHPDLEDVFPINYTNKLDWNIDVIFLCLPHGTAKIFVEKSCIPDTIKIIDLSRDFRIGKPENYIYGLPELNRNQIVENTKVANPGCFATCIELALLPIAQEKNLNSDIHITAITGSTGAGKGLSPTTHFTWRTSNLSVYKVFQHQHIEEIVQSLKQLQNGFDQNIFFVPMRGNFTRGIFASLYTKSSWSIEKAIQVYKDYYKDHPFVSITDQPIDMKQIINTNKVKISVNIVDGHIHLSSIMDNLIKGASGQAVQNMNLMCGLSEDIGLNLKSIAY